MGPRRRGGRLRRAVGVALIVCGAGGPAVAEEFAFLGPAPVRNFQPIQLIFLNLPFERAATLPPGGLALQVESAEINEIATTDGAIQGTLKFESNRTVFGLRYGLTGGWEAGLDLPFISRYGGFLDPVIDGIESLFGSENPERKLFPDNSFGAFIVTRGDTVLFEGGEETFQPGDLVLSAKRALRTPPEWPRLALRAAVKMPTGDAGAVLGSGKPDFGLGAAAEHRPFDRLMLYLNANFIYPVGPITAGDLTLNPMVTESFAAHVAVTQRWSAMLHQAVYTSPFHTGARLLDGTVVELGLGVDFAYSPQLGAQLLAINNVSGVEQAADFTLLLALRFEPWASEAALPQAGGSPAD